MAENKPASGAKPKVVITIYGSLELTSKDANTVVVKGNK